jgi:hypothetical protein
MCLIMWKKFKKFLMLLLIAIKLDDRYRDKNGNKNDI